MHEFKPFVSARETPKEFTPFPLTAGSLLGIVFGASSLYLALKVGVTVSASIPVAVLSITLFKVFSKAFGFRRTTILENNMVQTVGSAGESIAFGVAVTMPALLILGYDLEVGRILTVAIFGGLMGVLMMIPLRRALIVHEHGTLTYPEGTACAEVLIVGERGGSSGRIVFGGFFFGLLYKVLNVGLRLWHEVPAKAFGFFKGSAIAVEISPELLGVGYIIGLRTSSIMFAGGLLSSFVLIPMIALFGEGLAEPLFPAKMLIKDMGIHDIWRNYILYVGAGGVAAGGIISLCHSLPTIVRGARAGLKSAFGRDGSKAKRADHDPHQVRTEDDLPAWVTAAGTFAMLLGLWLTPVLHIGFFAAVLIMFFGFLFVTVSSRLTGELGSSSNPSSGMTVATLLFTCLLFLLVGWIGPEYRVGALSIAAVVCIAASNGGTTSQDLKTGYLVGATPKLQQIGLLIGVVTSALVIGFSLVLLNDASTIYSKKVPDYVVPDVGALTKTERVRGPEAAADSKLYHVFRVTDQSPPEITRAIAPGKYLVDDGGRVVYLVDPGINGVLKERDNGASVTKFEAPKARLMSLIIDGILTQKLPWSLVLLGVALAIVLEVCGVSALPFAVGVYLPISASAPLFVGGLIRHVVDRRGASDTASAESDEQGSGVLLSSGLIAGGAIGGIVLAFLQAFDGVTDFLDVSRVMGSLGSSDVFAMVMFTIMAVVLYRVGRHQPDAAE